MTAHAEPSAAAFGAGGDDSPAGAVERLLDHAVAVGASDVHLEPASSGDGRLAVRLRRDGVLAPAGELAAPLGPRVITRLKVLANLLSYRHDIAQEGRIDPGQAGSRPQMRVAVFPTVGGERAVVRLFTAAGRLAELDQLGLSADVADRLAALAGRGDGMILLTGPAGSGKTTTIYALLRHLVARWPGRSVLTLEDPVEQLVAGVSQSQVGGPGQMGFAAALRSALRQDPQVLVVGEVRDGETAAAAVQAALSGHLLISTIHAGSAAAVFARLLQIGIEPFQVASSVTAVLAQRLPRRLCPACRGEGSVHGSPDTPCPSGQGVAPGGEGGVPHLAPPAGGRGTRCASPDTPCPSDQGVAPGGRCEQCNGSGFAGRTMLAELLVVGEATREAVMARGRLAELAVAAAADGLVPLADRGAALVRAGLTTPAELARVGVE